MKNWPNTLCCLTLCLCMAVPAVRAQGPVIDPSFAITSGTSPLPSINAYMVKMLLQPDGKLVVLGGFIALNGYPAISLARLLPDGQFDTTFVAPQANRGPSCIALQDDGKILIGGAFDTVGGQPRPGGLARLLPNGRLDNTFVSPFGGGPVGVGSYVKRIVVQDGGRGILLFGYLIPTGSLGPGTVFVARLQEAFGALDLNFQPGFDTLDLYDMLALPNGNLVFVGAPQPIGGQLCNVWGTWPDGGLNPNFAPLISAVAPALSLGYDPARDHIYVLAAGIGGRVPGREVIRLLPNGNRDNSFSTAGAFTSWGPFDSLSGLAVQPNGRVLLASSISLGPGNYAESWRLLPTGARDPSYQPANGPSGPVLQVLAQPDGKMLFCGLFTQAGGFAVSGLTRMLDANTLSASHPQAGPAALDAWPVPAHDVLHLRLPAPAAPLRVALLDALGREVRHQTLPAGQATLALPTAGLPPGVYLLHVPLPGGPALRRVAVE